MVTPGQSPDTSWLPAGMDPDSSYLLKIRLTGNPKKSRKDFSCFKITKVVDSDLCNFKDFVEEIVDQYPHGYNEVVHVFYHDDVQKTIPKVTTDQELLDMFRKHALSKVVHMTISYSEPTDDVPIPDCYTPENSESLDIPCTPSMVCPSLLQATQVTEPISIHPTQPTTSEDIEPTTSHPTQPTTSEPTDPSHPAQLSNDDDDGYLANPEPQNEHVGVDDEGLYLTTQKAVSESEHEHESESESESESDEDYEEEDGLIGKDPLPPVPIVAYDKNDPPMNVGSTYPNMQEFRLALSQHAIKHEFQFDIEKSDPGRLRAYCSRKKEEGCRWRLHASIMKDNTTIKVKKNPHRHKCTSARRSKNVKNATKFWICEQVKDWLMEDSRVGPKELQWRIKDKYKVQLPYKRVFDAGRRHNERFKGCMEAGGSTTKRKGSHQCPICKNYGHRWYNCKNGDPEDIAAMLAERGPPKKKKKKSEPSCESAILPVDSVPKAMHFPPSQRASTSMDSNSLRSAHGSNQPELLSIEYPVLSLGQTTPPSATSIPTKEKKKATGKGKGKAAGKGKGKAKEQGKKKKKIPVLPDSPAMSTRSKTPQRQSPAAHTRSKRKLPDLNL